MRCVPSLHMVIELRLLAQRFVSNLSILYLFYYFCKCSIVFDMVIVYYVCNCIIVIDVVLVYYLCNCSNVVDVVLCGSCT